MTIDDVLRDPKAYTDHVDAELKQAITVEQVAEIRNHRREEITAMMTGQNDPRVRDTLYHVRLHVILQAQRRTADLLGTLPETASR